MSPHAPVVCPVSTRRLLPALTPETQETRETMTLVPRGFSLWPNHGPHFQLHASTAARDDWHVISWWRHVVIVARRPHQTTGPLVTPPPANRYLFEHIAQRLRSAHSNDYVYSRVAFDAHYYKCALCSSCHLIENHTWMLFVVALCNALICIMYICEICSHLHCTYQILTWPQT